MFGSGKQLYNLTTTEKGTGREQISKSLPKEIKAALGPSKYERLQQITKEKRKAIKEKEYEVVQKEKNKKEMDEIRQSIRSAQRELESLENSDGPEREIEKVKAKLRTLESEHVKARNKYYKSIQAEKDQSNLQVDISVLEDIQQKDLEEEEDASEALKAIEKRKEAVERRIKFDSDKFNSNKLSENEKRI